jgi:hypothetical protein
VNERFRRLLNLGCCVGNSIPNDGILEIVIRVEVFIDLESLICQLRVLAVRIAVLIEPLPKPLRIMLDRDDILKTHRTDHDDDLSVGPHAVNTLDELLVVGNEGLGADVVGRICVIGA